MNADSIQTTLGLNVSQRPKSKWPVVGAVILLLLIAGGIVWWYDAARDSNVRYITAPATITTLTTTVSATGNLEPTNTVDVGIEVSGTISDVVVDYNDRVSKGSVMARLDVTKLSSKATSAKASLAKSEAAIAEATATLHKTENEWERVQKMMTATGGNYPSKQEADNAKAAYELAKASVNAAKAQRSQALAELESAQEDLRKAVVISPVEGIVLERKVEPGQTVVAAMQTPVLFKMAEDLTKMRVIVSVDEADVGEVKEGQRVRFTVDAYPGRYFKGRITQLRLNSQIVNGVVTYNAVVAVDNEELLLRPGMTASAYIITGTLRSVLTVPNAALRFIPPSDDDKTAKKDRGANILDKHVWILREGIPAKIGVQTSKTDGIRTAVESKDLRDGQTVIVGVEERP